MNAIAKAIIQESLDFLSKQEIVSKIYADKNYLHVYFRSNYKERWLINPLKQDRRAIKFSWEGPQLIHEIPIKQQYDVYSDKIFDEYFLVLYSDYTKGGFLDQRMVVHNLVDRIMNEGWVSIKYPKQILKKAAKYRRVRKLKFKISNNHYQYRAPRRNRVKSLYEHFFDWYETSPNNKISVLEAWTDPILISKAINKLLIKKRNLTRYSICEYLNRHRGCGNRRVDPSFWSSISEIFGDIEGKSVLDLSPDWGWKFLAYRFLNIDYHISNNYLKPLTDFVGFDIQYDNKPVYDIVFLSNTEPISPELLLKRMKVYQKRAEYLFVIINQNDLKAVADKIKPSIIIDLTAYHIRFRHMDTPDRFLKILIFERQKTLEYSIWNR